MKCVAVGDMMIPSIYFRRELEKVRSLMSLYVNPGKKIVVKMISGSYPKDRNTGSMCI